MPRVPGSISVLAIGFQGLDYLCLETFVKGIGEQGFFGKRAEAWEAALFLKSRSEARDPYRYANTLGHDMDPSPSVRDFRGKVVLGA